MPTATTASEYAERYLAAFETGSLTQGSFHTVSEHDGRRLACALGVIGDEVNGASQCPASIMPRWLAQMVPAFFDRQKEADAFPWGVAFTAALARIDGKVPFSVIHDWHASTVCRLSISAAEKRGDDPAPHKALQALHLRALAGEKILANQWLLILRNASADASASASASADAYASAYASASAYADASADAYADASASASASADAYASAYASASAWKLLADGMVAALSNVDVA